MNNKQIDRLMTVLLGISAALIITGAVFRIMHWPNGLLLVWIGFMSSLILSSFEINRLKGIIKVLEKKASPM
jgi:membrane protease YdiL (CAAX protease family)